LEVAQLFKGTNLNRAKDERIITRSQDGFVWVHLALVRVVKRACGIIDFEYHVFSNLRESGNAAHPN
jgi:hypothetical protein